MSYRNVIGWKCWFILLHRLEDGGGFVTPKKRDAVRGTTVVQHLSSSTLGEECWMIKSVFRVWKPSRVYLPGWGTCWRRLHRELCCSRRSEKVLTGGRGERWRRRGGGSADQASSWRLTSTALEHLHQHETKKDRTSDADQGLEGEDK